jgi:hypothetical protein
VREGGDLSGPEGSKKKGDQERWNREEEEEEEAGPLFFPAGFFLKLCAVVCREMAMESFMKLDMSRKPKRERSKPQRTCTIRIESLYMYVYL